MRDVIQRVDTTAYHIDNGRVGVDANVLCYLVVGALYESAVHRPHRVQSALGHARNHGRCLLLGNAHVDVLFARQFAFLGSKACSHRCAGCNGNECGVVLHFVQHPVAEQFLVGFDSRFGWAASVQTVEGQAPVPCLLVGHGGRKAMPLFGVNVHHGRLVGALHTFKHLDKLFDVVALLQIFVFKAPCLEPVVRTGAVALAQRPQIFVDAAVVLGNRHLVVVHHNDDARAQLRSLVKPLKSHAARERAVANDGNDVLVGALDVARLLQSGGQTDRSRGVSHLKVVVLRAFGGR